jgi:hypothetical protein
LKEQQWGRDIAALSDLRFFHKLGNLTVKSSESAYVGKRYDAFLLDLSSYASTRVRGTKEVEFWTPEGSQTLRAASHVFTPDIAHGLEGPSTKVRTPETVEPEIPGQATIFDEIKNQTSEASPEPS